MKSSYVKKVITFITVISLFIVLLSGCGGGNKNSETDSVAQDDSSIVDRNDSSTDEEDSTKSADVNKDPLGKYHPPIDISFIRDIDDDLASNVLPKTPGETIEDNRWFTLYREELGINVTYDWTARSGDVFTQKLNVTLASGDLPDVITVNASQLKQLADSGMIEDMTQHYEDYASDLMKHVYTKDGTSTLDSATFDGRLMAIPSQEDNAESAQYLWIRTDWLEKLNLEPPKTMEDLLKISEAFTTQDPDGNGQDDTYGLAVTKDLYSGAMGLEGFFAGYHAYPNIWVEDSSGKLVYGSTLPEVKVALEKLAEMYKAGQIDKEFAVKDGSKVAETIAAGKIGINFGEQWNPMYPLISNYNNDNNADWVGYPIVSTDDQPVKVPLAFRVSRYYAVKKGYEHPEALVKMINLYTDINCGERSKTDYNKYFMPPENDNVGVWKFSPVTVNPPLTNFTSFLSIEKARETNDMSELSPAARPIVDNIEAYKNGDKSQWGWDKIYGEEGVFRVMKEYQDSSALLHEKFVGAPTETMVEKQATLEKMEKEVFVKIIMGAAPISEFDKFVEDWYALGGADITKEVNDWYSSVNSN